MEKLAAALRQIYVLTTGGTMEKVYPSKPAPLQTWAARLIAIFGYCGSEIVKST
jgi:hypothetical protein